MVLFGRCRGYGLVGENVSLEGGSESLKTYSVLNLLSLPWAACLQYDQLPDPASMPSLGHRRL